MEITLFATGVNWTASFARCCSFCWATFIPVSSFFGAFACPAHISTLATYFGFAVAYCA